MTLRAVLSIAVGLVVIFFLGSIAGDVIKHLYTAHSDFMYVVLQLTSGCFSCAVGGAVTALVGRSRGANLILGILFTALVVFAALRIASPFPAWYGIVLAILITPAVLVGAKISEKKFT